MRWRKTRDRDAPVELRRQYELLAEQAKHSSAELENAINPVMRASAMAALASLEESIAILHELTFPADDRVPAGDVPLPTALRSSAALLKFIAVTEDAPAAEKFVAQLSPESLAPGASDGLVRVAWPYLRKLAVAADPKLRAVLLTALHAELLAVVGPTAAETVSWLAGLATDRAATGARM